MNTIGLCPLDHGQPCTGCPLHRRGVLSTTGGTMSGPLHVNPHLHTRTARALTWLAWRTPIRTTRHARFLIALASIHELIYHPTP